MSIEISDEFFDVNQRPPDWQEDADVRRAVDWFVAFMNPEDWRRRRFSALQRFVNAAGGGAVDDPAGRFFVPDDQFAWYLFLGQAYLEHPTVYDFMYGSRVIPVLRTLGHNLSLLQGVEGATARAKRLVGAERAQPNGGLFELLVAAAYRRSGAHVRFLPEQPGDNKTHDFDARLHGKLWAVECKRMEVGEYSDRERYVARRLWLPIAKELQVRGLDVLAKVQFLTELHEVPKDYFVLHAQRWLNAGTLLSHSWSDQFAVGSICRLDLRPLHAVLATDDVAMNSSRLYSLLTGEYKRNAHIIQVLRAQRADNPLYLSDVSQAIVLDWESRSQAAIDAKARDVRKRLSDAVGQLPDHRSSVVHLGLEAVDGMEVEAARFEKVFNSVRGFDPRGKKLDFVYINWFAPESPPDSMEAFDETCHWAGRSPAHKRPLDTGLLMLGSGSEARSGVHWLRPVS